MHIQHKRHGSKISCRLIFLTEYRIENRISMIILSPAEKKKIIEKGIQYWNLQYKTENALVSTKLEWQFDMKSLSMKIKREWKKATKNGNDWSAMYQCQIKSNAECAILLLETFPEISGYLNAIELIAHHQVCQVMTKRKHSTIRRFGVGTKRCSIFAYFA